MAWELRLLEDTLAAGASLTLPAPDVYNRVCYVVHGSVSVGGESFADDSAWHGKGAATLLAGPHGAALWRFELVHDGRAVFPCEGRTLLKLSAPVALAGEMLMRCDSVAFPAGGCALLHTHQGPGIRCLIEGGIRIDTDGHSTSHAPGSAWFEAGPEPVFAQAANRPSRFIRVMLLPVALRGKSSIAYVREEDRSKPKSQSYKGYVDAPITLD